MLAAVCPLGVHSHPANAKGFSPMTVDVRNWQLSHRGFMVVLMLLATTALAGERRGRPAKIGEYNPNAQTVEMFSAIAKGDIAVKLIPKDSTECRVMIENKTGKPLNVKLPDAFAGVPVLAQVGGGGVGGGTGSRSNSSANQGFGGGMGGMGMGGMGGGMGMFSVPPEQVGQFKVPTVCLEHGKADPRPAIPYEIQPIESFTTKAGVRELCQMLGSNQVNQRAAQAAAWHLNNDMSWQELAAKTIRHANGMARPYFTREELQAAVQLSAAAERTAKERQSQTPPTTTSSSVERVER